MSELLDDFRTPYDRISIPTIWVAFAVSVLLHALLLWGGWLPDLDLRLPGETERIGPTGPLVVRLQPPPKPAPSPPPSPAIRVPRPEAPPAPAPRLEAPADRPAPKAAPPAPPRPELTAKRPAPEAAPPRPAPSAAPPAPAGDLSSYIEARRRARGEAAPPQVASAAPPAPRRPETEAERIEKAMAANLGLDRAPTYDAGREAVGGIFQIERLGVEDAEFLFFGWNPDIRRNTQQRIEVRRGSNADIRIAVVRRMIELIRENADGDFVWISSRLGRNITLSARPRDNAGLEDFLMQEFFGDPRRRN